MIKTKTIKTDKAEILVLGGLPEGANRFKFFNDQRPYLSYFVGAKTFREYVVYPGNWQPLGFLKDIAENVAKELVESTEYYDPYSTPFGPIPAYKGYLDNVYKWRATESLHSLIAVNCNMRNKYGEYPTKWNTGLEYGMRYIGAVEEWEDEQEKVFTNPYLLKKI